MSDELEITPALVGQRVRNPARPEWGVGTVLRVQTVSVGGQVRHRVSIQFDTGHRTLHVPPARLTAPAAAPERAAGWLERASGNDLDGRLRGLPAFVREFLGTPRQRLAMLAPLFACDAEPTALARWARQQTGVGDPLAHWTRDELLAAFGEFCARRDQLLRATAAELRRASGPEAVARVLGTIEQPLRQRMEQTLQQR